MDAVVAQSRDSIIKGSNSFRTASRLFGKSIREDVWLLYAWCRHCDDEIDGQNHGHGACPLSIQDRRARLDRLRLLTAEALAGGNASDPAFAALRRVSKHHRIDTRWPLELLDGLERDVEPRTYASTDDTLRYCWGVAGVVGVMMAMIMGARNQEVLRRAQDLGLAFQLTNICRDIVEDARSDRVYLPEELLSRAGVQPTATAVLDTANRPAVFGVARALLELAELYYRSARAGLRDLPFRAALAVAVARGIYREIGRRILRTGPDALAGRMTVPRTVMMKLLARGALVALWSRVERLKAPPPRPTLWSRI